jgi:hypothetical protein
LSGVFLKNIWEATAVFLSAPVVSLPCTVSTKFIGAAVPLFRNPRKTVKTVQNKRVYLVVDAVATAINLYTFIKFTNATSTL